MNIQRLSFWLRQLRLGHWCHKFLPTKVYPHPPKKHQTSSLDFILHLYVSKVKLATVVEGNPKAPFSIATTPRCRGGHYSFPWITPLDTYLIMLSVKQDSIKYHFLSFWYDSTWDWTQISRAIGEPSNHYANGTTLKKYGKCYCPIGYQCEKWNRRPEFKSLRRLFAFHFMQIPLGINLFSSKLRVNSRADWAFYPCWGNQSKRRTLNLNRYYSDSKVDHMLVAEGLGKRISSANTVFIYKWNSENSVFKQKIIVNLHIWKIEVQL